MISKILIAAILTCAGSAWIDRLYRTSKDLTFPEKISERARFRRPLLFCALAILFCAAENFWACAAIFLLVLMTATDFEQYMLFDAMTVPLAVLGAIFAWQMNLNFVEHTAAALIGGGIFLLLAFLSRGAIGGGDVKLIAALGFWFGAEKLLHVVTCGAALGGLSALLMILAKKKDRNDYFAYGPYFAFAAIYFLLTS